MPNVVLLFPNTSSIAAFVLENKVPGAQINSTEQSLSADLSEDQIVTACTRYGALLKGKTPSLLKPSEEPL